MLAYHRSYGVLVFIYMGAPYSGNDATNMH